MSRVWPALLLFVCWTTSGVTGWCSTKPNIVLIFADDLGWQDTGFGGSDFHETPNLDRLAKQGMIFRQAYSSAGNCQPSRACLISGQYTPRHGVYAVGSTKRGPVELMRMEPVPNTDGLKPDDFSIAKALKQAGYATGIFGKWHLSGPTGSSPEEQGFDVVQLSRHTAGRTRADDPKAAYSLTEAACNFITDNRDRPFFVYLPHYAVHSPIESRAETLAKFEQKTPGTKHNNPKFAACVEELDNAVGILMQKLIDLKLDENTLVAFTSDNGGTATSQEPLRGSKGCYYEGGIREPMFVRWPAVIKAGTTCDVPVINVDFYPTFLAAAGGTPKPDRPLDGESLLPLLQGKSSLEREAIFWHFPGYLDGAVARGRDPVFRTRPVSVIRKGDWKLHLYHEEWQLDGGRDKIETNRAVELYNIADDPREMRDLASSEPTKRDELVDDLCAWFEKTDAKLPTNRNSQYDPATKSAPKKRKNQK
ncbi:MAG TPA: sulfatase [Pirellulales bacterium]|nr:sulfatase [Pirellulales bacterium]